MNIHMPDLSAIALDDGIIRLTQRDYGDEYIIDLHVSQLHTIAEQLGLLKPASLPRSIQRQLSKLYQDASALSDYLGSVPSFPPQSRASEDQRMAAALFDGLESLLTNLGLIDDGRKEPQPEPQPPEPPKPSKFKPKGQQGDLLDGIKPSQDQSGNTYLNDAEPLFI